MKANYWWKNPINLIKIIGKPILKVSGEGCQARNEFQWLGIVRSVQKVKHEWELELKIEIIIHNFSYGDNRDKEKPEFYTYLLCNADIQNVKGTWILFT